MAQVTLELRRVLDGDTVPDTLAESDLLELYRRLILMRTFDERAVVYHRQGRIGTYAIFWNHEAIQVGATYPLTPEELTDAQLEQKLVAAETCFKSWKKKTYAERAVIIAKASAIMHTKANEFAHIMTLEMGKRIGEARGEVEFSSNILAYYAKNAERFLAPQHLSPVTGEADIVSTPFGVLFGVEPWNFPYYQLARIAGPHLMAGNTLVVKHAGIVPQCALAFEKLLDVEPIAKAAE